MVDVLLHANISWLCWKYVQIIKSSYQAISKQQKEDENAGRKSKMV